MHAPFATFSLWGQTLQPSDAAVVGLLIILEGVLSIDNALVLGLLARRLPKPLQKKALTYGLVGALVFRIIAIALATVLLKWWIVKLFGGAYLLYVAGKHFIFPDKHQEESPESSDEPAHPTGNAAGDEADEHKRNAESSPAGNIASALSGGKKRPGFWPTVAAIELTDIAFALDSILAAIALVGGAPAGHQGLHPKLWVIVTGGMLGVILMRMAAALFIRLLDKFPRFETSAYLLVALIGVKLLADWWFNKPPAGISPGHAYHGPLDFQSASSPTFWAFWGLMAACLALGFVPGRKKG